MKKIAFALAALVAVGCSNPGVDSPTDVARSFNENIMQMNLEKAYASYSSRIKNSLSFESFKKNFDLEDREEDSESMKDRLKLDYSDEIIEGSKAVVYGRGTLDGKEGGKFRVRMVQEDGKWRVDSEVLENESFTDPGFYRSMELTALSHDYIQSMLKGDAKVMWELTSKNAKGELAFNEFAVMTTKTDSGKRPIDEGFNYELNEGIANDSGAGIAYIKLTNGKSKNQKLIDGLVFRLPFVLEDDKWKADFTKIDERYWVNDQK